MDWSKDASRLSHDEIYDKLKGCIFGAAIGDAVGLATEFLTKKKARILYGIGPIAFGTDKGYEFYIDSFRERWGVGDWTDDTDQQLLIIDSLISNDGIFNTRDFSARLTNWINQGYPELDNKPPYGIGLTVGSVLKHPKFSKQPHRSSWDVWVQFGRNMAANGALMRTAVLGVPFFWDEKQVIKQTLQATKVTHADPRCCISSVIVTMLVSRMIKGDIQDVPPDLDDEAKEEIIKWMQSGNPDNETGQDIDELLPSPLSTNKHAEKKNQKAKNFISKIIGKVKILSPERRAKTSPKPRDPVVIPDPPPPGIETFGADPIMLALTRSLVERYKFMTLSTLGEQQPDEIKSSKFNRFQTDVSEEALMKYCFPDTLAALNLDEPSSIGYVYKCLGAALYCLTRNLSEQNDEGKSFKKIITELTLEAGDADTNATVAGALLGARIGYSKLPQEWVKGLKYKNWLTERVDNLWTAISERSDWVKVENPDELKET